MYDKSYLNDMQKNRLNCDDLLHLETTKESFSTENFNFDQPNRNNSHEPQKPQPPSEPQHQPMPQQYQQQPPHQPSWQKPQSVSNSSSSNLPFQPPKQQFHQANQPSAVLKSSPLPSVTVPQQIQHMQSATSSSSIATPSISSDNNNNNNYARQPNSYQKPITNTTNDHQNTTHSANTVVNNNLHSHVNSRPQQPAPLLFNNPHKNGQNQSNQHYQPLPPQTDQRSNLSPQYQQQQQQQQHHPAPQKHYLSAFHNTDMEKRQKS
jgi:hypothetical protein